MIFSRGKLLVWFVAVGLAAVGLVVGITLTEDMPMYRSEAYGFQVRHPMAWEVQELSMIRVVISPSPASLWGPPAVAPSPNPWVEIHDIQAWGCGKVHQTDGFQPETGMNGKITYYEQVICRDGFTLVLGYYDADPDKENTRQILEAMLRSFRKIS